jgi:hypothetical protein
LAPIAFRLFARVINVMYTIVSIRTIPASILDVDVAAFNFHDQYAVIGMSDEEINLANRADGSGKPFDAMEYREVV